LLRRSVEKVLLVMSRRKDGEGGWLLGTGEGRRRA